MYNKKIIVLLLVVAMLVSGCSYLGREDNQHPSHKDDDSSNNADIIMVDMAFDGLPKANEFKEDIQAAFYKVTGQKNNLSLQSETDSLISCAYYAEGYTLHINAFLQDGRIKTISIKPWIDAQTPINSYVQSLSENAQKNFIATIVAPTYMFDPRVCDTDAAIEFYDFVCDQKQITEKSTKVISYNMAYTCSKDYSFLIEFANLGTGGVWDDFAKNYPDNVKNFTYLPNDVTEENFIIPTAVWCLSSDHQAIQLNVKYADEEHIEFDLILGAGYGAGMMDPSVTNTTIKDISATKQNNVYEFIFFYDNMDSKGSLEYKNNELLLHLEYSVVPGLGRGDYPFEKSDSN